MTENHSKLPDQETAEEKSPEQKAAEDIINECLKDVIAHKSAEKPSFPGELEELNDEEILKKWKEEFAKITTPKSTVKLFNDPIHGSILLNPLEVAILNTPEFYRLRDIKQLGGKSHVYPGAVHTRFEHSIGVCYLAGEMVRHLNQRSTAERTIITDEEELCIRLAGLCHDLGHGPFSHLFEQVVEAIFEPTEGKCDKVKHEKLSVLMFKKILLEHPKVLAYFVKYGLQWKHVEMIGDMINCSKDAIERLKDPERGNQKDKIYLYEIVANKDSGMDVDKWDYFARDCYFLGVKFDFDYRRCMTVSRVIKEKDGCSHIAFRDKEILNIYGMFRTRCMIHHKACTHKVGSAIDMMIKDAIVEAKDLELLPPQHKEEKEQKTLNKVLTTMCKEGPMDLSGYLLLSDTILTLIRNYHDPTLDEKAKKAQFLVERIMKRDTYTLVSSTNGVTELVYPKDDQDLTVDEMKKLEKLHGCKKMPENVYEIECAPISYGSEGPTNPVKNIKFYKKETENDLTAIPEVEGFVKPVEYPTTTPKSFKELKLRLFRKEGENEQNDEDAWEWFKKEVETTLKKS